MFNLTCQHSRWPNASYKAMCISAQTACLAAWQDGWWARRPRNGQNHMLFIVALLTALIAVVGTARMRVSGGVNSANLGWMSQQWLAEHRASPAR
jgi:hypothetical protein